MACIDEPTPNKCVTVVDPNKNKHSFVFYFAEFIYVWFRFALRLDGNPATVVILQYVITLQLLIYNIEMNAVMPVTVAYYLL